MSELETVIRGSVGPDAWVADWDEVLRRAGRSRFRTRRAVAVGAVAAAAVVLLLPGIGIGGGLNALLSGSRPGLDLRAELSLPGGRTIGSVSVHTSRIFVAKAFRGRKPFFIPRGHKPVLPPLPIRWSLDLQGASVRSARIVSSTGSVLARLCAPCSGGAHGTVDVPARAVGGIFGRAVAVVETGSGTARGRLRLTFPPR